MGDAGGGICIYLSFASHFKPPYAFLTYKCIPPWFLPAHVSTAPVAPVSRFPRSSSAALQSLLPSSPPYAICGLDRRCPGCRGGWGLVLAAACGIPFSAFVSDYLLPICILSSNIVVSLPDCTQNTGRIYYSCIFASGASLSLTIS